MSAELVVAISALVLIALIVIEVPIALSLIVSGVTGLVLLGELGNLINILGATPYTSVAKYALFVICMYVLLGSLISNAGIGIAIFRAVNRIVGRLPGGLAATAVGATTMFSGISGSSVADVAAFGRISVQEMSRYGYRREYAAAVVAAAGAFAALIPPAIGFVLYGILAEESISALIFAGIVPGVLSCLMLMAYVIIYAALTGKRRGRDFGGIEPRPPAAQPAGPALAPTVPSVHNRGSARDFLGIVYAAVIFLIVVGGLYSGQFTATEAGAVGAVAALVITVIEVKKQRGSLRTVLRTSFRESVGTSSMIFLLLAGGGVFGYMITLSGLPQALARSLASGGLPPMLIAGAILLLLVPLGMVIDGLSLMLIVVPIVAPIVTSLGMDGVWFGVLVLKAIEIGLITPPVGINVFVISAATGAKLEGVFVYLIPFVALDLALTAVYFLFPDLVLWLPALFGLH
ncbi:MAG TPA: TRAP transporter large permease [Microbacteriaceae bacterium]|nr:TRAP transporter large permease [Microbacteriaceae bacterium]